MCIAQDRTQIMQVFASLYIMSAHCFLCDTGWCKKKYKYWLVCIFLLYTDMLMVPSSSLRSCISRKGSSLSSDSFSTVNCELLYNYITMDTSSFFSDPNHVEVVIAMCKQVGI